MKRLHIYIVKSFLGPFFMTFFICMFVLLMQFLWKYVDDMVGKGLEWSILGELLFYASFGLLPFAFPLAMLLASIMTFGSLGENYELVAIKSSGISLFRIMRPLIIIAFLITVSAFYFANNVLPRTNLRFITLLWSVKQQRPELVLKEGVFTNDIDGYSIRVDHKNKKTNMLYDVLIYDHTKNKSNESVTVADSAYLEMTEDKKYMVMTLYNGTNYEEEYNRHASKRSYPHRKNIFEKQVINIKVNNFEFKRRDESIFRNSYRMLNIRQLLNAEDSLHTVYKKKLRSFITKLTFNRVLIRNLLRRTTEDDSLRMKYEIEKPDTIFDFDQAFASLGRWKKKEIIREAIDEVRSNNQQINMSQNNLYGLKKKINKHEMERHRKFSLSLAVFIFFFIGAPLGAIIRKGGLGMPVVISILLFISYYIVSMIGEKSAREDVWPMFSGMWFSSFIFFPIGVWLTYKAITDSDIMKSETYIDFFKKLKKSRLFSWLKKVNEDSSNNQ